MKKLGILTLALTISVAGIALAGCQEQPEPLPESLKKGAPKLDSRLNELVDAEGRGEAISFAGQNNIELVDERVRVIVECVTGQVDTAAKAASTLGVVESSHGDLLQVVLPIGSLTTMADQAGVYFVRLPQQPLPGSS